MIETINYNKNEKLFVFENLKLLSIDFIKNIFNQKNWSLSFEKDFKIQTLDYKISKNIIFGDRVVLIFQKN